MRLTLAGIAACLLSVLAVAQSHPDKEPLVVVTGGGYGYINHNGEIVIQPQYWWGTDFVEGFATVYVCGRLVSIDESGKLVPLRHARPNELRLTRRNEKVGFKDASGQFTIKPIYDDALPFSEGLAAVQVGKLWGFIDTNGHQVIRPMFKAAYYFIEGVGTAETKKDFVLIDKSGSILATGLDLTHGIPHDGLVPVGRNDKYGYLDLRGKVIIPLEYDDVKSFSTGLAAVRKGTKWGYIDTRGRTALPFMFDETGPFASGLAPAKIGNESGFIDRSGKFAFHLAFEYAPGFLTGDADGMFVADYDISRFWTKDHEFGYVNTSGKVIWGPMAGSPDHAPITSWSDEDKVKSCEGIPQAVREEVAQFPEQ